MKKQVTSDASFLIISAGYDTHVTASGYFRPTFPSLKSMFYNILVVRCNSKKWE